MTTTAKRPSAARKHTRTSDSSAEAQLEQGIRITLDGEAFEVRLGDVTSTITRELRAKSGMSFTALMEYVTTDPDTDVIAAFVWLARKIRGEQVDFDDVVVTYQQLLSDGFDVSLPDAREADEGPEA